MARSIAGRSKGASQGQLRLEQARAAAEAGAQRVGVAPVHITATPAPPPLMRDAYVPVPVVPFGEWLLRQKGSANGFLDSLARAAVADRRFPRTGNPEEVRAHIEGQGADPDFIEAIDDAEAIWARG